MQFHFHANQSHFHKNGFAFRLALKQGTRELAPYFIADFFPLFLSCTVFSCYANLTYISSKTELS